MIPKIPPLSSSNVAVTMDPLGFIRVEWYQGHEPICDEDTLIGWFCSASYHIDSSKVVSWTDKPVHIEVK